MSKKPWGCVEYLKIRKKWKTDVPTDSEIEFSVRHERICRVHRLKVKRSS